MTDPTIHKTMPWWGTVLLACMALFSGWLLAGKGWLENTGALDRQIEINTRRLDRVEQQESADVSRKEHDDLINRVTTLEAMVPTRQELVAGNHAQQTLIENLSRQISDLREQVVQVRILLNERTLPSKTVQR